MYVRGMYRYCCFVLLLFTLQAGDHGTQIETLNEQYAALMEKNARLRAQARDVVDGGSGGGW